MKLDYTLRKERDRELIAFYKQTLKQWLNAKKEFTKRELIEYVITHGKPRYHLGFDYSLRMIKTVLKLEIPPAKPTLHQQMWIEISSKVDKTLKKHDKMNWHQALAEVLAFNRASRFFISYQYAKRIINEIQNNSRNLNRA